MKIHEVCLIEFRDLHWYNFSVSLIDNHEWSPDVNVIK